MIRFSTPKGYSFEPRCWRTCLVPVAEYAGLWATGASRGAAVMLGFWLTQQARGESPIHLLAPPVGEWLRRRPALDPLRWSAASLADDFAYGLGVWRGCFRERVFSPLIPSLRPIR